MHELHTEPTPSPSSLDASLRPLESQLGLFPGDEPDYQFSTGVLPIQDLRRLAEDGAIHAEREFTDKQFQPSSLDLRLGDTAYRVPASFLPGQGRTVRHQLDRLAMHTIDLREGGCLEAGCVYVVPVQESLRLRRDFSGLATPKSTTGRLDIFTRLLSDNATSFDRIAAGYRGPLYVEVAPRTFSVIARSGDALNQIRIRRGTPLPADTFHREENARAPLTFHPDGTPAVPEIDRGLVLSVDLLGTTPGHPVAFRAKRFAREAIDLRRIGHYPIRPFWEPIFGPLEDGLILRPDEFYILATRERVRVGRDVGAEMVAYDTSMGEFRIHYAGFFDPGFGDHPRDVERGIEPGTRAVLEVRSHDAPVLLEHGQRVGRLVYERLLRPPRVTYGSQLGSNYAMQGVKLAKQFRGWGDDQSSASTLTTGG